MTFDEKRKEEMKQKRSDCKSKFDQQKLRAKDMV